MTGEGQKRNKSLGHPHTKPYGDLGIYIQVYRVFTEVVAAAAVAGAGYLARVGGQVKWNSRVANQCLVRR
jgi:hypothetical protein